MAVDEDDFQLSLTDDGENLRVGLMVKTAVGPVAGGVKLTGKPVNIFRGVVGLFNAAVAGYDSAKKEEKTK